MAGDDIYSALVGGVPSDPEKQAALAAYLRQQANQGRILQASGDRVLGPMGEQMTAGAGSQAEELARARQAQDQFKMMQAYREAQADNMAAKVGATIRGQDVSAGAKKDVANIQGGTARDVEAQRAAAQIEAARIKAEQAAAAKQKPPKPIPEATRRQIDDAVNSMTGVEQAQATYRKGFGGTGRNAENWVSANVPLLASKNMEDAQNWWANYGRQFTLPELKATIGLRHNQYMQGVFESYHLNPNMEDKQIVGNLGQIHDQVVGRVSRQVQALQKQGYDITGYERFLGGKSAPAGTGTPTPPQETTAPALRHLRPPQGQPAPGPQPQAPNPQVRPTPPVGNLFTGMGDTSYG